MRNTFACRDCGEIDCVCLRLWVRVGDAGNHEDFGDDLLALTNYLNDLRVGQVGHWFTEPPGVGFDTPNYYGWDFISLFWGDADANLVRSLNPGERAALEAGLEENYL